MRIRKNDLPRRLLAGVAGLLACVLAALLMESVIQTLRVPQALLARRTRAVIFDDAVAHRLVRAKAKTGDVQITLAWNNGNDLDLWCVDPFGEHIFFGNRIARSAGELDIDMNAGGAETNEPIENIYWPRGEAPSGKYQVFVNYFANHGAPDPTAWTVDVLNKGRRSHFQGTISPRPNHGTVVPVTSLQVTGGRTTVPFLPSAFWNAVAWTAAWFAALAALLFYALVRGQDAYFQLPVMPALRRHRLTALSALAGAVSGALAQVTFTLLSGALLPLPFGIARLIGWALAGAAAGYALGRWTPNLPRRGATRGGLLGGILAALAFSVISQPGDVTNVAGRVLGAALLGFCIGWMLRLPRRRFERRTAFLHGEDVVVLTNPSRRYRADPRGRIPERAAHP